MTRANKIASPLLLTLIGACLVLMAAESVNRLMSTDMVAVAFAEGGDDGYYYLTVARNAARGLGVTVDGVEWTSGFQPLWALVCTVAYLAGGDRAAFALLYLTSYALRIASAFMLVRFVQHATGARLPILAVPLIVGLFLLDRQLSDLYLNGMESGLHLSSLLLFLLVGQRAAQTKVLTFSLRRAAALGLSAGFLMLARNDGVFVCAFLMSALLIADRSMARLYELLVAGAIACALVLPWIAYCYWVLGTFMPQSGVATAEALRSVSNPTQALRAIMVSLVPLLFVGVHTLLSDPPVIGCVMGVLLTIGLAVAVFRPRSRMADWPTRLVLLAFAASNLVLFVYYFSVSSAIQFYDRYFGPTKLLVFILLSLVIVGVARRFADSRMFAGAATVAVVAAVLSNAHWIVKSWDAPYKGYFGGPAYALARSPLMSDGSRIGMMESGRFGFMLPERVVNLDGKMRVTALRALQNGKLYEEIMRGDFDYLLLHGFDSAFFDERAPAWRQHYGEIGEFDKLVVYKRR